MRSRLLTNICTRWIAIFVVWFASLAPTVSHALYTAGDAGVGAICSSSGVLWTGVEAVDDSGREPSGSPASRSELGDLAHCAFCICQGHDSLLPSEPLVVRLPDPLRFEVPRLYLRAKHTLHAWASAQPRAPPSHFLTC